MKEVNEVANVLTFMTQHRLSGDEFILLWGVYMVKENRQNTPVHKALKGYFSSYSFYDRERSPIPISWSDIVQKLVKDSFLIAYEGHTRSKEGKVTVDLSKLEVTDKFKKTLVRSQREELFDYYVESVYGPFITINGDMIPTNAPVSGESYDQLMDRFWARCNEGLSGSFDTLCANTVEYFEHFSRNMKISTFLKDYPIYMKALAAKKLQDASPSGWTTTV